MQLAREARVPVFFDVNLRPSLWSEPATAAEICYGIARECDVVKLSLDDAMALMGPESTAEAAIERFLALGPRFVVLTDGERGCWFASAREPALRFVPSFVVEAVEPTGAGDAFGAALIARSLANNWQPPSDEDIRYAAAAGALTLIAVIGWGGLAYYRLHGSPKVYHSAYPTAYLNSLACKIAGSSDAAPVWCIFDNTAIGAATADALTVLGQLRGSDGIHA